MLLVASGTLSLVICGIVLQRQGLVDPAAWATVAAALAVLAAIVSAWTSQRQLELQEDAVEPALLPAIDVRSRTNLAQFTITNHGGSHAYDVTLEWKRPLPGLDGKPISLGAAPIPMIPKGESASVLITSSHELISKNEDTTFTGTIRFRNVRGRKFSEQFMVTAEHERIAMVLATDEQELKQDIKKIREALESIVKAISKQ
ncbi:MAG: hypothetical protein LAO77_17065 [Acidobacteriia bacterium]|nr:hypothetical protein [Terriglobia bacterium]